MANKIRKKFCFKQVPRHFNTINLSPSNLQLLQSASHIVYEISLGKLSFAFIRDVCYIYESRKDYNSSEAVSRWYTKSQYRNFVCHWDFEI